MSKATALGGGEWATALTIAGSDSGGGAGIQADLKTFAALEVHGVCAVTCITAQNPRKVTAVQSCRPLILRAQLEAVQSHYAIRAAKCGMLGRAALVEEVVRWKSARPRLPLVVDPVMVSTSGRSLLSAGAMERLRRDVLPLARLVTPNVGEAELLVGWRIDSEQRLREAARAIWERFGCGCLLKGGHLRGGKEVIDCFCDRGREIVLRAPRSARVGSIPGTGCTFSAAITAFLARGRDLPDAVRQAKRYLVRAVAGQKRAGRTRLLNHGVNGP